MSFFSTFLSINAKQYHHRIRSNKKGLIWLCLFWLLLKSSFHTFEWFYLSGPPCEISNFRVTDELLKKHFDILYTDLEPREIADELFQAGLISVSDHDIVTDSPKKYNRLRSLLKILELKKLHGQFLHTLESFHCDLVLKTLKTDTQFQIISGKLTYNLALFLIFIRFLNTLFRICRQIRNVDST